MFRIEYFGFGAWHRCGTIADSKANAIQQAQANSGGGWLPTRIINLNTNQITIVTRGI
jgi:hypothetical protein